MRSSKQFFHDMAVIKHQLGKTCMRMGLISEAYVAFAERRRFIKLRKGF